MRPGHAAFRLLLLLTPRLRAHARRNISFAHVSTASGVPILSVGFRNKVGQKSKWMLQFSAADHAQSVARRLTTPL